MQEGRFYLPQIYTSNSSTVTSPKFAFAFGFDRTLQRRGRNLWRREVPKGIVERAFTHPQLALFSHMYEILINVDALHGR